MNMSKSTFKLTPEERMYLAERMKMERSIQGMSQNRVAKEAGFNSSVISLLENCRIEMTYIELEKIAKALTIDVPLLIKDAALLAKIEKYYKTPTEENTMIEMEAPEVIEEVEAVAKVAEVEETKSDVIEEIQISDVLINRVRANNTHGFSVSQILNASMNWFASSHADMQKEFIEKYTTDRAIVKTRLDLAIAAGQFEVARELLDLYEKISQ